MSILAEADRILNGDRQEQYDDPTVNFERIATVASLLCGFPVSPEDCCKVLIALKIVRMGRNTGRDSKVDLAAYAEILQRIQDRG